MNTKEYRSFVLRVEDLKVDADRLTDQGIVTEEQRFAFNARETLRELLIFLDEVEQDVLEREMAAEHRVQDTEAELDEAERKLAKVRDYVEERKMLRVIEDIIK